MNVLKYPLPIRTAASRRSYSKSPTNPGLLYDRFAPWESIRGSETLDKRKFLAEICREAERVDKDLLNSFVSRWQSIAKSINAEIFELETDWRFLTGIGLNNRLEVGFLFNKYGFPLIPGSGCKGIARSFALAQVAEKHPEKNINEWDKEFSTGEGGAIRAIFGTQVAAGHAIFLDAIPLQPPRLEVDVMTPHFVEYYSGDSWPLDSLDPKPIPFLTVAPKQKICFAVGWRGEPSNPDFKYFSNAADWLKRGLTELGAGAKTNAGYGYFSE